MNMKNFWAIGLLLTAVVPFATGCNECEESGNQAKMADKLGYAMDKSVRDHDLSPEACRRDLLEIANILASKRGAAVKHYCDGELCDAAKDLSSNIKTLQQNLGDACRATDNGGIHPGRVDDSYSPNTLSYLREARKSLNRMSAAGDEIMTQACSPKELMTLRSQRDADLARLASHETANTTTSQLPSIYNGNNPPPRPAPVEGPANPASGGGTAGSANPNAPLAPMPGPIAPPAPPAPVAAPSAASTSI